jgi:hypothetical protein
MRGRDVAGRGDRPGDRNRGEGGGGLDSFISRRHEQRRKSEPERELEAAWVDAERREAARRRQENRVGWYGWHMDRATLYARLRAEHEVAAAGLMGEVPCEYSRDKKRPCESNVYLRKRGNSRVPKALMPGQKGTGFASRQRGRPGTA